MPALLQGGAAPAADWARPLEAYRGLASSFGEYRPGRFHAGVDFSTGGRNGRRVRAAGDGEIFRLHHSRRGYGKAVYIRHRGGFTTVYAHLQAFTPALEKLIGPAADKNGGYAGDFYPDKPIAVKRGDTVGFSGESGEGLPHLHFELRDEGNNPLNPYRAGFVLPDSEPPRIADITLTPLDHDSAVNGASRGEMLVPLPQKSGAPLIIRGRLRITLNAYDTAGNGGRLGLHRLEAALDGKPFLSLCFDAFSYGSADPAGAVFDPLKSHLTPTVYAYNLFRHPGAGAGFIGLFSPAADGCFHAGELSPGPHVLAVIAADAAGNSTRRELSFIVNRPPRIESAEVAAATPFADLLITDADGGPPPRIELETLEGSSAVWRPISLSGASSILPEPSSAGWLLRWRAAAPAGPVRARAFDGMEASEWFPWSGASEQRSAAADFRAAVHGSFARFTFKRRGPFSPDRLRLEGPSGEILSRSFSWLPDDTFEAIWPFEKAASGDWKAAIEGDSDAPAATVAVRPILAVPGGQAAWPDLRLQFPPEALYENGFINRAEASIPSQPGLPMLSAALDISSTTYPFRRPAEIRLKLDRPPMDPRRSAVCLWDPFVKSWRFMESRANGEDGWLGAEILHGGIFAALEDASPPAIGDLGAAVKAIRLGRIGFRFKLADRGMGVDDERVTAFIDGLRLKAEYDPDRRWVTAELGRRLTPGKHRLSVTVYDRAGNKAEKEVAFRIP